ncbi:hypothetical protein V6N13_062661 [Hibiscus sabdariffa]|uniref:Transthyretin/hydroxyisourate hydrolase domain-containing protein n=1 Tax=Hibiscus sabdariffa TaxID=183260 RepID=A0ABR2BD05_9ROSI
MSQPHLYFWDKECNLTGLNCSFPSLHLCRIRAGDFPGSDLHLTATLEGFPAKAPQVEARTPPPITTHVLDVSRGCPAAAIEVRLEMWKGSEVNLVHHLVRLIRVDGYLKDLQLPTEMVGVAG